MVYIAEERNRTARYEKYSQQFDQFHMVVVRKAYLIALRTLSFFFRHLSEYPE
jgi:hypothetical protein